jgi:hypothetical protein
MASRLVLLLVAVVASLCAAAVDQQANRYSIPNAHSCSITGNYTGGSQYEKNLYELLTTLSSAATTNGWFNTSTVGAGSDQVFGLIMCYADCSARMCLKCLAGAPATVPAFCRGSRNVSAIYECCLLRYSDTRFFAAAEVTYGVDPRRLEVRNALVYATDMYAMAAARSRLMELLAGKAGDLSQRFYNCSLPYTEPVLNSNLISGLAQCTRDLAPSECNRCISGYTQLVADMFPNNTDGAIAGHSCYLRYTLGVLVITMPPEPALPPPMPPSPVPVVPLPKPPVLALAPAAPVLPPPTSPMRGSKSFSSFFL